MNKDELDFIYFGQYDNVAKIKNGRPVYLGIVRYVTKRYVHIQTPLDGDLDNYWVKKEDIIRVPEEISRCYDPNEAYSILESLKVRDEYLYSNAFFEKLREKYHISGRF